MHKGYIITEGYRKVQNKSLNTIAVIIIHQPDFLLPRRPLAIRIQIRHRIRRKLCPILLPSRLSIAVGLPVSRPGGRSTRRVRLAPTLSLLLLMVVAARHTGRRRALVAPVEYGLVPRTHILVEVVRFVHLIHLCLLRIKPTLQQLRVISRKNRITLLDLAQLQL